MSIPKAALLILTLLLAACSEPAPPTLNLYRAVAIGDLDQIKRHLHWGTDLNQADAAGDEPLHVAARQGNVASARLLLGGGADPQRRNVQGRTPLQLALIHGKTRVAELLKDQGVPIDSQTLLIELAGMGVANRDSFEFLLRQGAHLNLPVPSGETALTAAILGGHLETAARLILLGADVNQSNAKGQRPLDLARSQLGPRRDDRARISELLERNGALPGDQEGGRGDQTDE
ncbi:ankyrin repeat domain-containing protein [Caldichromatium japonicum]|uniref:Ankyrin repeat domain-containing protein n=1 Tax=Caldichromatium japonicum TaxID=2699430 RepID=A0A6G7VDJ6_9GAMM|nr:ankyrin repeat domain-containing protein [Caldichromatium japonicum]QIK37928.1 ankyrin repeat domain-containing protein [Caldichromatium japonicum]